MDISFFHSFPSRVKLLELEYQCYCIYCIFFVFVSLMRAIPIVLPKILRASWFLPLFITNKSAISAMSMSPLQNKHLLLRVRKNILMYFGTRWTFLILVSRSVVELNPNSIQLKFLTSCITPLPYNRPSTSIDVARPHESALKVSSSVWYLAWYFPPKQTIFVKFWANGSFHNQKFYQKGKSEVFFYEDSILKLPSFAYSILLIIRIKRLWN